MLNLYQSRIGESSLTSVREQRMIFLTPEEQRAINRGSAGLSKDGDQKLLGSLGFFTNKTTGAISDRSGTLLNKPAIESAAEIVESPVAVQTTATRLNDLQNRASAPGVSQAEKERLETVIRGLNAETPEQTAKTQMSDAQSQAEAARINRAKREEDIRTKEGEAGRMIERGQGALLQAKGGREGVQSSTTAGIIAASKTGGEKLLSQAISADPEINRLNAIESGNIAKVNALSEAIKTTRFDRAEDVLALQDQFEDLQKELTANATDKALKTITQLGSSVAQFDVNDFVDFAVAQGLDPTLAKAIHSDNVALALAQKSKDETAIQQAEATLQKTLADIAQVGVSDTDKTVAALQRLLNAGTITQEQFSAAVQEEIGIGADPTKLGFTTVNGKLYSTDPKTGKATLAATDENNNPIAPAFSQVGNGQITYNYGSASLNAGDNPLLQNGKFGTPGIDIDGNTGDVIQAFVSGTVTSVANDNGYGNQVIVTDEQGNQHMYSHLREIPEFLAEGQTVTDGMVLGYMGNTGSVFGIEGNRPGAGDTETGSHLDYRIKGQPVMQPNGQSSAWINPNVFIANKPVDFKEELIPLYKKFGTEGLAAADWTAIDKMGISPEDFAKQALASATTSDEDQARITFAEDLIEKAQVLKNFKALAAKKDKSTFGIPGLGGELIDPRTTAALAPFGLTLPFSESRNFKVAFDAFISKLSLDNLVQLKSQGATFGALSDNELRFITNAASKLNIGMGEADFQEELSKLILIFESAIPNLERSSLATGTEETPTEFADNFVDNYPVSNPQFFGSEPQKEEAAPKIQPTT